MAKFCMKCGASTEDKTAFCPSCGTVMSPAQPSEAGHPSNQQAQYKSPNDQRQQQYQGFGNAAGDADNNKVMGILAYLGILVLVPIFAAKDSPFARYHANQGLVLAIIEVAYVIVISILIAVFSAISWRLAATMGTVFWLLWLAFLPPIIIGIINAAAGNMKPLPVIGGIRILK